MARARARARAVMQCAFTRHRSLFLRSPPSQQQQQQQQQRGCVGCVKQQQQQPHRRVVVVAFAEGRGKGQGDVEGISSDQPINEEVLQRLQEAENEAAELRKQLADMKTRDEDTASSSSSTTSRGGEVLPNNPSIKVDSVSSRENFLYPTSDVWLGEKDALLATKQFLAKDGLSESSYQSGVEEEDKPVVLRRLLIGVVGTIGA